jgi:molybdopterin-biosynthesis enzyme MoeA-like protein
MEQSITTVEPGPQQPTEILPLDTPSQLPVSTFTKVDNNLTGIGFFTASSKRSRREIEKTTVVMDHGVERRISIIPSAKYGLPITQDQDYWLALMKLVSEHIQREGRLTNPFTFTTAQILKILGHQRHNGKNYKAVQEWLSVMKHTGIEGGAYNVAKKKWSTDRVSAVDRAATIGEEFSDGTIADKNHIWFSQWQLDNINAGNLIAVELGTYIQLENNISKNLVPHLQEWLFASQHDGRFEKRYEDICQLLGIRVYRYRSQIEEKLGPSLDELVVHGYISKWAIEPMANRKNYKLVLWHGSKYHADRQTRLSKKPRSENLVAGESNQSVATRRPRQRHLNLSPAPQNEPPTQTPVIIDYNVVAELTKRGVGETDARQLLAGLPPGQPVREQLEHADYLIEVASHSRNPIQNAPGFYISHLRRNVPVPPTFETSQAKKSRQDAILAQQEALRKQKEDTQSQEETEEAALNALFDALTEPDRLVLLSEVKAEKLAVAPKMAHWFEMNPEANSFLLAGARKKLKEGWTPKRAGEPETTTTPQVEESHYAINPDIRQATSLQESPEMTTAAQPEQGSRGEPITPTVDYLNLKAILATLQLMVPLAVEQPAVKPAPAATQPVEPPIGTPKA